MIDLGPGIAGATCGYCSDRFLLCDYLDADHLVDAVVDHTLTEHGVRFLDAPREVARLLPADDL